MGAGATLPLSPVKVGFSTISITFVYTDRIIVLHADTSMLSTIRQAIGETWLSGIQNEQSVCELGWCFKLVGNPFTLGTSSETSKQSRLMVCLVLQRLFAAGYKIVGSIDLGRFDDKSTIFLKKSSPEFSTLPFICVGLSSTDKLQFVNLPTQLVEPIKAVVHQVWTLGIQKEEFVNGVLEMKLSGNPWIGTDLQSVLAKLLLQNIVATLNHYQWVYYCNVNLKSTADSLIFRYDPNLPVGTPAQFCTFSFNRTDRLRLMATSTPINDMVRQVIQTTWAHGKIQEEREFYGSWEFKLSGNPWHSTREESILARYLVLKILEAMQAQGWHVIAGIDINRRPSDKSVLIFKFGPPKQSPLMCLSLNDVDKFRLINVPSQLVDQFRQMLLARWHKGIQAEKIVAFNFGAVNQIKMSGFPWIGGFRNDTIHIRSFLCNVFEEFSQMGWKLLLCADVSAKYVHQDKGPDYPVDLHSLWFIYEPETQQQPPAPVYGFSAPAIQQPYGFAPAPAQQSYPPPTQYGMPATQSAFNDPPPSYSQAMGNTGEFDK